MAKIYGINGVISGKTGAAVYAVRNGEQIMRQYQPIVANPSTAGQVASRAKLKLMSQLSTVMAPVIAMPRKGAVSSRNLFVKTNYPLATYATDTASINLTSVALTRSVVSLPGLQASREGGVLTVGLLASYGVDVSRVVYAMFIKQPDGTLRYASSAVISTPGANFDYTTTFQIGGNNSVVVYAYGVRDNTEAARVTFGNMQALTAETVAKLITSKTLLESDITLTETKAVESNPS